MSDVKLKDRNTLRRSEYATAIMGAVSDETNAGETRKFTMAEMAEILAVVAPVTPTWERTTLFDGDATPEANSDRDDFSNTVHNLGFKRGSSGTRHNLTDGYTFFVFYFNYSTNQDAADKKWAPNYPIPSILILEATESSPTTIPIGPSGYNDDSNNAISFAKNTDTSFKIVKSNQDKNEGTVTIQTLSTLHLSKIEGLKMVI